MSGMKLMLLILAVGLIVPILWSSVPVIKDSVHFILDPSLGSLLSWNVNIGLIIVTAILTFISTIIYKYTTDQKTLKEIKEEQKLIQEEMKKYRDHPEKMMEHQKRSMELSMKTMPLIMRPLIYTTIPLILLFRWFADFFIANPVAIFGFMNWIIAYLIFSIIFSNIFRKMLKVH